MQTQTKSAFVYPACFNLSTFQQKYVAQLQLRPGFEYFLVDTSGMERERGQICILWQESNTLFIQRVGVNRILGKISNSN